MVSNNGYENHERLHEENAHLRDKVKELQAVVDAAREKCLAIIHNPQRSRDATLVRSILRALDGEAKP